MDDIVRFDLVVDVTETVLGERERNRMGELVIRKVGWAVGTGKVGRRAEFSRLLSGESEVGLRTTPSFCLLES